jgi:hypothetical protein
VAAAVKLPPSPAALEKALARIKAILGSWFYAEVKARNLIQKPEEIAKLTDAQKPEIGLLLNGEAVPAATILASNTSLDPLRIPVAFYPVSLRRSFLRRLATGALSDRESGFSNSGSVARCGGRSQTPPSRSDRRSFDVYEQEGIAEPECQPK